MNEFEDFLKGHIAFSKGLFEDSLIYFQTVLEDDNHNPESWYNVGVTFLELGDYDRAIYHYDMALEITPDDDFIANAKYNAKKLKYKHQYNIK
jgi:tetratricopeptide (TPR) repeat protein